MKLKEKTSRSYQIVDTHTRVICTVIKFKHQSLKKTLHVLGGSSSQDYQL